VRLKLHVGLHKTATTSIQQTLSRNRDLLAQNGWSYPVVLNERDRQFPNHAMPFYAAFLESYRGRQQLLSRGYEESWARPMFRERLAEAVRSGDRVLMSGEGISLLAAPELAEVRRFFDDLGVALDPICFVRSPSEMAASGMQENIKHGHKFMLKPVRKFDAIERLKAELGHLETYPFARAKRHPLGPVGFFIETLGLGDPEAFEIFRKNDSMSDRATRLIGFVNRVQPISADRKPNPHRFYDDARPLWDLPGRKFVFTEGEQQVLYERIMEENEKYRQVLGPEYCDDGTESAPVADAWSEEASAFVAAALPDLNPLLWPAVCLYLEVTPGIAPALADPVTETVLRLLPEHGDLVRKGLDFDEEALRNSARFVSLASGTTVRPGEIIRAARRVEERIAGALAQS